jgi:hypothetical protein
MRVTQDLFRTSRREHFQQLKTLHHLECIRYAASTSSSMKHTFKWLTLQHLHGWK